MKKTILHVELIDKLEYKEMYDKMDFIDIFMLNHRAQDNYTKKMKKKKLDKRLKALQAQANQQYVVRSHLHEVLTVSDDETSDIEN